MGVSESTVDRALRQARAARTERLSAPEPTPEPPAPAPAEPLSASDLRAVLSSHVRELARLAERARAEPAQYASITRQIGQLSAVLSRTLPDRQQEPGVYVTEESMRERIDATRTKLLDMVRRYRAHPEMAREEDSPLGQLCRELAMAACPRCGQK